MNGLISKRSLVLDFGITNTLILSVVCAAIIWYIQWRKSRKHLYELAAKVPGPSCVPMYPILGHCLSLIGDAERILKSVVHMASLSSSPCGVWLAHRLFFILSTPADLEIALNSPKTLAKDDLYRFSQPLAGAGLFNLDVDIWKVHRKLIMPTFNPRILDQFVEVFVEQSNVLVKILSGKVGKVFDIEEYITAAALEMVTQTAMGSKITSHGDNCDLPEKINRGLEIMFVRMFNVPLHSDFIFNLTSLAKEQRDIILTFTNFIKKVVGDKKAAFVEKEKENRECAEAQIHEEKERKVFLDQLLELSRKQLLTDSEIIDEVRTFMIAASDTSSTVISFACICLGLFPNYQQKLYDEVIDVVGLERDIECNDLPKLKYVEKFIKETMRLFPIGPNIVRKVTEDLEIGGHTLPKDSGLVLCIFNVHRNEKYYPDPLRFDPERFTPEECSKRHPYAYLPFSGGPRNCIGVKFAYNMVKVIVASIIRRFYIETTYKSIEEVRIKQSLILKSALGYPVKLTNRHSA